MAWLLYLIGIVMMIAVEVNAGMFLFAFGMLIHWKFWILTIIGGTIAFCVGAGWSKPSL